MGIMSALEALAFHMYGTLVDPIRIWKQLERVLPREAQRIAELWRQKQLEYTFRLTAIMHVAGLHTYCAGFVSVDEVRVYKPSPKVYRHVANRLGRPIETVRLISSNPFDVVGAEAAGMQASWVNRSGGVFDTLAPPPHSVVRSLIELADTLAQGPGGQ
jgi:hypothetical protein